MTQDPIPTGSQTPHKRLVRSQDNRWLGGVCGGLAEYFGVDANLIRLLVVIGTIFGMGTLLVAYIAAWILMPEA
jgi:phage shock protein PspC (stress-responsive transcriptional regulator)